MVSSNREDYQFQYDLFLMNEAYETSKMELILNNSILNESSVELLTEGAVEKLKEFITNIVTAIANAWDRFVVNMDKFATENNKYLEKYEKIIKGNKPKDVKISNFYKYDIAKIKGSKIPDSNIMNTIEATDKKEVIKSISEFKDFMVKDDQSFTDNVKFVLRGAAEAGEVKGSELKMTEMYDYVHNYNQNIKTAIQADLDRIKEGNNKAFTIINSMKTRAQAKVNKESFDYSETIKKYFLEADDDTKEEKPASGIKIEEEPEKDSEKGKETGTDSKGTSENTEDGAPKKDENAIKMYFNICSEFLGARLSIAQEAYKTYMKIIKWHVKNYVKEDEATETKPEEKKEETKSGNTEAPSTAEELNKKLDK